MKTALEAGYPVRIPPAGTVADGIAVRAVGAIAYEIVKKMVDEIVTVSEGEIANALLRLIEVEKTVAEGAAAVGLAALINKKLRLHNSTVGIVLSGGNIDVNLMSR